MSPCYGTFVGELALSYYCLRYIFTGLNEREPPEFLKAFSGLKIHGETGTFYSELVCTRGLMVLVA